MVAGSGPRDGLPFRRTGSCVPEHTDSALSLFFVRTRCARRKRGHDGRMADETVPTPRERIRSLLDDLRTMRDELRVQIHLGTLEAQTRWKEDLLPRVEKLERDIEAAGRELGAGIEARTEELRDQVRALWSDLKDRAGGKARS